MKGDSDEQVTSDRGVALSTPRRLAKIFALFEFEPQFYDFVSGGTR